MGELKIVHLNKMMRGISEDLGMDMYNKFDHGTREVKYVLLDINRNKSFHLVVNLEDYDPNVDISTHIRDAITKGIWSGYPTKTIDVNSLYPGTIIRTTHNPYMDKNYFIPARHCGLSAARMFIDEFADVRRYCEADIKATEELFNNIYYGRTVSFGTLPKIEKVLFNAPATIVFWKDGTKTVVKAQGDDEFDPEKGLAMAICKKALGNDRDYYEVFLKHVGRYEKQQRKAQEMFEKLGKCANKGYLDSLADGMKRFAEAARQVAPHMPGDSHDS